MELVVALGKDDLAALVGEISPLEVEIAKKPRRTVSLGAPSLVELVPSAGLRVRGDARFAWDALGLTIPITVRSWQVLLAPTALSSPSGLALAFEPTLERLDLSSVPVFVSETIAQAITSGLAAGRKKLVWNVGQKLSLHRMLSERVSPPSRFELSPSRAEVVVTAWEMRLTLGFDAHVVRGAALHVPRRSA
jgi:hypothetical protein